MRRVTAIDLVSCKLDAYDYVVIPTKQVGALSELKNGNGEVRNNAIQLHITDINEMIYSDKVQIMLGGGEE